MVDQSSLGECSYCLRVGRKRNLAKVTWLTDNDVSMLCPHCLPEVIADMMTTHWVKKDGYKIEYPYK